MQGRLFIISNRMPVSIEHKDGAYAIRQSSGGLVSAISAYLQGEGKEAFRKVIWAGVPDVDERTWRESLLHHEKQQYEFLPVFVQGGTYDQYYNGFSNSILWPLFHYFPSYVEYETSFFDAYMEVNRLFAAVVAADLKKEDVVWIHDYHLMPLAAMLRERCPSVTIGFFLHIPFPSFELLRIIPRGWQHAILEGLLGADLIGFHTIDYAAHFLTSVQMVLKLEHDGRQMAWQNRKVRADAFPISIDYGLFNGAYELPDVRALRDKYRQIADDRKLVFSVDRLDYSKGVYNRLRGYELFLSRNPGYAEKVIFALVIVPSRDSISKYAERKKMIDEYIGRLNSNFGNIGWQPILYQYSHLTFEDLMAMYTACDLALITPLRDGMNLVAKEFAASRKDRLGVLVLSEMAGAARELTDALIINPNDVEEIAAMIRQGLEMPAYEQTERMEGMQRRIRNYDVHTWANDYFQQLRSMKDQQLEFEVKFLDAFNRLQVLNAYTGAARRLLLLDYDGTLVPFSPLPRQAAPGSVLLDTLKRLAAYPQNTVYLISGRDSDTLQEWFGDLPIGLISEHGAKVRAPGGEWMPEPGLVNTWKDPVLNIMEQTVIHCPGSFTEQKDFSIAWHYRNTEPAQAGVFAKELHSELAAFTRPQGLEVLDGNKVIEVRSKGISKGMAAGKLVGGSRFDFILAIGDDRTDEDMFRELARVPGAYTVKVGSDASFAQFNLHNASMVTSLLENLAHA